MYVSKYNLVFDIDERREKILLNPLFQLMDIISDEDTALVDFLKGNDGLIQGRTEDIEYLSRRGYIHDSPEREAKMLTKLITRDDQDEYPCDFLLYPTFSCNLRCIYCFQNRKPMSTMYPMISKEYVNKMLETIEHIAEERGNRSRPLLYLFGGEPLLREKRAVDIIRYILSSVYHKGFRLGIITNGSNLGYYAAMLKKYDVEFVQITMDGPEHIHNQRRKYANGKGTFDDIVRGVESILDSKIRLLIRVNLDAQNIASLPEFADFVIGSKWHRENIEVFVGPYRDLSCRSYQYQLPEHVMLSTIFSFYSQMPQTRIIKMVGWPGLDYIQYFMRTGMLPAPRISYCISSYGRLGFDAEGYVYACGTAAGKSQYAIGTYYPKLHLEKDKIHAWRRHRFTDMPQCVNCRVAPLCGGGCTLQSLLKYSGEKPFCPEIIENLKVILNYYFNDIAKT